MFSTCVRYLHAQPRLACVVSLEATHKLSELIGSAIPRAFVSCGDSPASQVIVETDLCVAVCARELRVASHSILRIASPRALPHRVHAASQELVHQPKLRSSTVQTIAGLNSRSSAGIVEQGNRQYALHRCLLRLAQARGCMPGQDGGAQYGHILLDCTFLGCHCRELR